MDALPFARMGRMQDPRTHTLRQGHHGHVELVDREGEVVATAPHRSIMYAPQVSSDDIRRMAGDIRNIYVDGIPMPLEPYLARREQRHLELLERDLPKLKRY